MKISTEPDRTRYIAFLQAQQLPLDAQCAPWKDSRSNEQNALLFGAVYPPIAEAMGYEVDDIHTFMCGTHFGWVDRKVPKTPRNPEGIESQPFRTTTKNEHGRRDVLKKVPFSQFIETVERIAVNAGVFIPRQAA